MSIGWRKILRDLGSSGFRTLLVILSSAVGVFALGLVFGLSSVMSDRLTRDHRAYTPAHITFWGGQFTDEIIAVIGDDPDVVSAEGEVRVPLRWKQPGETEWRIGDLIARADYAAQTANCATLIAGSWPGERDLAVEQQSLDAFGLAAPSEIVIEVGRRERSLPSVGVLRMAAITPPQFGGNATFFAMPDTVAWLTGVQHSNLLHVRIASFSEAAAEATARRIEQRLDRVGVSVGGYQITDPNVHWLQPMVDTVSWILTVLGALSLALSAFLIVNTLQATLAQQVWQIGVMKVVGATSGRIVSLYLKVAVIYGLLAVAIAVPLSLVAATQLAAWLLAMINVVPDATGSLTAAGPQTAFRIIPPVLALQIGVGILTPVLAALIPVLHGARITPHQAIRSYGLAGEFGQSWIDRAIGRVRGLPRPLALSLRNTFRRKLRVALTLFTLTLGGVMFLIVMSTGTSLNATLDTVIRDLGLDVWVVFDQPERAEQLEEIAAAVEGVQRAETWAQTESSLVLASGGEQDVYLMGVPTGSQVFSPNVIAGRGLLPDDDRAILLNNKIASEEGIAVGDTLNLSINGREVPWVVVGLIFNINEGQENGFVPFDALTREMGTLYRGTIVMVRSADHGVAAEYALMDRLREAYLTYNVKPSFLASASEMRQQNRMQFDLIVYLLLAMALLTALVSTMGLMGTMSLGVIERRREIGVLRAIGASTPAILGMLITEGVLLGLISWALAVPLSYPAAQVFSGIVGTMLVNVPLEFAYSLDAVVIALVAVVVLSALASLLPALRAARVSVREALAYE